MFLEQIKNLKTTCLVACTCIRARINKTTKHRSIRLSFLTFSSPMQWNKNINNPCETNFKNSLLIFIHSMSRVHLISLELFIICLELNRFFPANFKLTNSSAEHALIFFFYFCISSIISRWVVSILPQKKKTFHKFINFSPEEC